MKPINITYILISLSLLFFLPVRAIEPVWDIDFGGVFDNREGHNKYVRDKTYIMVTLAPNIGLKFTDKDRIEGGVVWNQPLENGVKGSRVAPTLFYRHEGEKVKFSMGLFPLTQLREPLPGFLWSDSLAYFQKNLRGMLLQYEGDKGFIDAYLDWRGIQSKETREAFEIVVHGEFHKKDKLLAAGGYAMMNHLAKTSDAGPDQFVVDNFILNPYIGIKYDNKRFPDLFSIKAGPLISIERNREDREWRFPSGLWLDLEAEYKFLGLKNTFYYGGKLFPMYEEFGNELYMGEAFFSSRFYDRLDIYGKIYKNKFMDIEAQLNFNFCTTGFIFYQRVLLNIYLDHKNTKREYKKTL